jgi:hypothetical protein
MKNSNETIGNRTRKLPARIAVPQPTELTRTIWKLLRHIIFARCVVMVTRVKMQRGKCLF